MIFLRNRTIRFGLQTKLTLNLLQVNWNPLVVHTCPAPVTGTNAVHIVPKGRESCDLFSLFLAHCSSLCVSHWPITLPGFIRKGKKIKCKNKIDILLTSQKSWFPIINVCLTSGSSSEDPTLSEDEHKCTDREVNVNRKSAPLLNRTTHLWPLT